MRPLKQRQLSMQWRETELDGRWEAQTPAPLLMTPIWELLAGDAFCDPSQGSTDTVRIRSLLRGGAKCEGCNSLALLSRQRIRKREKSMMTWTMGPGELG